MATTIVTARDLILTIATVNYDAQTTAATLVNAPVITTYQTLEMEKPTSTSMISGRSTLSFLQTGALPHHSLKRCGLLLTLLRTQLWQCHSLPSLAQSLLVTSFQYFRPLAALLQKHKQILGRC
jgi:hypothetical protein